MERVRLSTAHGGLERWTINGGFTKQWREDGLVGQAGAGGSGGLVLVFQYGG